MYGWLASRLTTAVIVDEFVLRRTREIRQWDMGIRHMNASSNAYRYYIMRNRAFIKQYYRVHGVYNPVLFGLGTTATFFKELIRLVFVAHRPRHEQPVPRAQGRRPHRSRSHLGADEPLEA